MAVIITREVGVAAKGTTLSNAEIDNNFINLNTELATKATGTGTASGTNTGDETLATIKTKLSITTLSGSNTGDQTIPTTLPNANAVTFTTTGGAAAGSTYTGAAILTVDYSTVGAAASGHTHSYQAADADLLAIGGLIGASGYLKKTAADTWTLDTSTFATGTGTASGTNTGDQTLPTLSSLAGQPLDADLTAIAALAGTTGLLKKTAANTWELDTTAYTTNTGTVTAVTATTPIVSSGGTAPIITHAASDVPAGTYNNVTVNTFGHVTAGSNTGYLTAEADTLATVTARGNTTTTNVSLNGGISSYMGDTGVLFQSYNASATNAAQFSISHALGAVTIANARGTITLNGNVTGSSGSTTGNAATATNSSQLNGLSKIQLWNNSGQVHSTYQAFSSIPDFGVWYMQNSAAADTPQTGSQYYVQTQGLGNDYAYSSYALMTAVARDHAVKYTYYRAREGTTWGAWVKAAAGYADTAGNGGVTSIAATTPIVASASTGAITLSHAASGATAGTYNNVTVNTFGHVTAGSNVGYITGYTEVDTLATVTGRGNTASGHLMVPSGEGTGFCFWADSTNYKISMGSAEATYQYGPVTDYSIKMQMDASATGRGFTWGKAGLKPVAGLNATSGNMQIAGNLVIGAGTSGSTTTPSQIDLGPNYTSGYTRDTLKVYLYNNGTEKYGFSVGPASDVQYHSNGKHDHYISNTLVSRTTSTGTTITGALYATTKSFLIPHPTKPAMQLRYGSLESPYHGVRLTGEGEVVKGTCRINLPDYIHGLCKQEGAQVQITNIKHGKVIWVEDIIVHDDYFTVACDIGMFDKKTYKFFWSFTAIRKDIDDLEVEVA